MSELVLVIGGARSGKSAFAENLALERGGREVLYLATAEGLDEEMRERIARHREQRPEGWVTIETPRDPVKALEATTGQTVVLLDCLTLWVTNELLAGEEGIDARLAAQFDRLVEWQRAHAVDLILISNEVGSGIVPDNRLARIFRDVLGVINQRAAAAADRVVFMVAGIPVELKKPVLKGED